ncbi:hydrolase [Ectothiorhodospiraceae bacterium WFHF3C12]|nr:hydrolase [Ectothiorhodospiraceae bacterium WFHF3C12]
MLLSANESFVLAIDCQEKLMPAIDGGEAVVDAIRWLMDVAGELSVPVLASEQYPKGLGRTVPALAERLDADRTLEKTCFSCCAEQEFRARLHALGRRQAIVAGVESHVCVLQTVLGLIGEGWQVFVMREGISSRRPSDLELAMARMRQCGAQIVSREMVAFEWMHRAGTDQFRHITRQYIR